MNEPPKHIVSGNALLISVSPLMELFRANHDLLNSLLWTSGITSHYFLNSHRGKDKHKQVLEFDRFFGYAEAWHPAGRETAKYQKSVADLIDQVDRNAYIIYRMTMVLLYGFFETFLNERVGPIKKIKRSRGWGPLCQSLGNVSLLQTSHKPVRLKTVLRADICRLIRNHLAHAPTKPFGESIDEDPYRRWQNDLTTTLEQTKWPELSRKFLSAEIFIRNTLYFVIDNALQAQRHAASRNKRLPLEFFLILHTFTNLDSLAFEIEEALIPLGEDPPGRIYRRGARIRRKDLVFEDFSI
jgi:hypothetical protein